MGSFGKFARPRRGARGRLSSLASRDELFRWVTDVRVRAERRTGELLGGMALHPGPAEPARKCCRHPTTALRRRSATWGSRPTSRRSGNDSPRSPKRNSSSGSAPRPWICASSRPSASVSEAGKHIEGQVVRKQRDGNRLLVKISTAQGPMLVVTQKVADLDVRLDSGDTVTLITSGYPTFVDDPVLERIKEPSGPQGDGFTVEKPSRRAAARRRSSNETNSTVDGRASATKTAAAS